MNTSNSENYTLSIPDKKINTLYVKLLEIFLKKKKNFVLDTLNDLIYVFGSAVYFQKKCEITFEKMKKGLEKHIKDKVIKEVLAKNPKSSYMSFPSGETTNFNFVYDFDVYVFSLKRCFDFLAKLPTSHFIGKKINMVEVRRLDISDFLKTIEGSSTKYNSLSKNIRSSMPMLVLKFERLSSYIKNLEDLRDKLIHNIPYKQIYFRASVDIKDKDKWEILRWEFLPKSHFNQTHNLLDLFKNHVLTASKDDVEPIVYNDLHNLRLFVIEVLTLILEFNTKNK